MAANRMSRADRDTWASARTLADLGELTARRLEGGILSQPGYAPGCGPDEETLPLAPVLAALNRAGFVTTGSQPGLMEYGRGGSWWEQRAAAEGFMADPRLLAGIGDAAADVGLMVIVHETPSRWRYRYDKSLTVTTRNGCRVTGFGVRLPRRHIRDSWLGYGICHPDAVEALCSAWQVTVIDTQWGRNDMLWRTLVHAVSAAGSLS